jgi:hypothetical protein
MITQEVAVVQCGALHDEMPSPVENHCFTFCRSNAICSHGNEKVAAAIEAGVSSGLLPPQQAQAMLNTLESTQAKLSQWADMISNLRKSIRERRPGANHEDLRLKVECKSGAFPDIEAARKAALDLDRADRIGILKTLLGNDASQWRTVHKRKQLEIAQPIVEVMRSLANLGLIGLKRDPVSIPSGKLLALALQRGI